jgi:uncharacterized membrane protein
MSVDEHVSPNSTRQQLTNCLIAGLVLTIVALTSTYATALRHAYTLATSHQPETFTELYFNSSHASPLPTSAPVGKVRTFSFHITNHENQPYSYHYTVGLRVNNQARLVKSGDIKLSNGQSADITVPFSMSVPEAVGEITVSLQNPQEHISFRSES